MEEESSLVERAASDPQAFAELYDRYLPVVYGYVYRRVNHKEAAEDITSQVFERVLRSIGGLREGVTFKVWLFRIAGNAVIDYYRSKGRRETTAIERMEKMADQASANGITEVESRATVGELLEGLPEKHREVLVLHYLEEMDIKEMADLLGIGEQACYMRVYRATRQLAKNLERKGITGV